MVDLVEHYWRRKLIRLIADNIGTISLEINCYSHAAVYVRLTAIFIGIYERITVIQFFQPAITSDSKFAATKAKLVELHTSLNDDREGL